MLACLPQQIIHTRTLERTIHIFLSIKLSFIINITFIKYLIIIPFASCILRCSGPNLGVPAVSADMNASWESLPNKAVA